MIKNINFRQVKYWMPLMAYPFILLIGYFVIDIFNFEVAERVDKSLVTTSYLNSELPSAQVDDNYGDRMDNMRKQFSGLQDLSGVSNVESDKDSLDKREQYQSRYKDEEAEAVKTQNKVDSLQRELQKRNSKIGKDQSADEFTRELSDADKRIIESFRKGGLSIAEIEKQLGLKPGSYEQMVGKGAVDTLSKTTTVTASVAVADSVPVHVIAQGGGKHGKAVYDDPRGTNPTEVVKKVVETSGYFNTVSDEAGESNLIKAIIDEEIKVENGSRVRLRLLDAVQLGEVTLPKGTYLYAVMTAPSQQRIRGSVKSVMIGDTFHKISLNLYDMDGLEGLYIPESKFRETAQDVAGSALSSSMTVGDNINSSTSTGAWVRQSLQNAYQRTSQALGKLVKSKRVRLKYGTHVYLVNSKK